MIGVDSKPEHAAVGDGEGAAGHLLDGQRAFLGALAELGDGLLDLGEAHPVGVADDRHDQPLGRRHRDRDVEIIVIDDLVALDAGVDRGHVLRGERDRLHEKAHEAQADAVLLLEQILVAGARVDHRRHVDVVERRQQRGGVLRFLEPVAMVWRRRVILTRSSWRSPTAFACAGARGAALVPEPVRGRLRRRREPRFRFVDRPASLRLRPRRSRRPWSGDRPCQCPGSCVGST